MNLAGRSGSCRLSERNSVEILDSRWRTTAASGRRPSLAAPLPRSTRLERRASSGTSDPALRGQATHSATRRPGHRTLSRRRTCQGNSTGRGRNVHTRKIPLRLAIVLGSGGGVMRPFANLARLGLGWSDGRRSPEVQLGPRRGGQPGLGVPPPAHGYHRTGERGRAGGRGQPGVDAARPAAPASWSSTRWCTTSNSWNGSPRSARSLPGNSRPSWRSKVAGGATPMEAPGCRHLRVPQSATPHWIPPENRISGGRL